jgi:hypothetical protein
MRYESNFHMSSKKNLQTKDKSTVAIHNLVNFARVNFRENEVFFLLDSLLIEFVL